MIRVYSVGILSKTFTPEAITILIQELRNRLKELSILTLPLLVESASITIMGMINTAMVAYLGEVAMAAAGHINNAANLPIAIFSAMTTGGTIVVAQAIGARNAKKAAAAGGQAVMMTLAIAIALTLALGIFQRPVINWLFGDSDPLMVEAGYVYFMYIVWTFPFLAVAQTLFGVMRGAGDVKNPMKINLLMNIVNLSLSYVLIIGFTVPVLGIEIPTLGMHGAGLAIAFARFAGMIAALFAVTSKKSVIRLNALSLFKPTKDIQKDITTLGIPVGAENVLFQVGRLLTQMFVITIGAAAGTAIMAANTVGQNVMNFVMIPGGALSVTVMVMVGHRVGRRDYEDIPKTIMFSIGTATVFMGITSLIMLPAGGLLIRAFNLDPTSATYFWPIFITLIVLSPFLWPLSFILPSALRAVGDVKYTMVVSVITMWGFRIILGYLLGITFGLGLMGVWIGFYVDWGVRSLLFFVRLRRKKWMKLLPVDADNEPINDEPMEDFGISGTEAVK